ncbi:MAG: hypothetical protein PWR10_1272 [Halanaerobiales bacterium]|nr:hypothetical protein [Halanaerobiales bacterium]
MKIGFFVPNLLSWSGDQIVIGGLERYAWALIELMKDIGWEVEVHQNANYDWQQEVNGVTILGHGVARFSLEASVEQVNSLCDRVLYGSILQKPMYYKENSIVISHGVWWDGKEVSSEQRAKIVKNCGDALKQTSLMISCDYNFLNVMRTVFPDLTDKIRVIPNFVDTEEFKPAPKKKSKQTLKILYPRRLDYCRGTDLFIQLANNLLGKENKVEFLMAIDHNRPQYNQELEPFLRQDRVKGFNLQFEEMQNIYRQADIVVIPSRYSEGTSFSCLEAMASGNAIIATDVGGLTNLIINGYNGILVPPRVKAIETAVNFLIHDSQSRQRLGKNARKTAMAFTLDRWRKQWAGYLKAVYLSGDG